MTKEENKTAHQFLMDKGVKSMRENYSPFQIENWIKEYSASLIKENEELKAKVRELEGKEVVQNDIVCPKCKGVNEFLNTANGYRCAYTDCSHQWK